MKALNGIWRINYMTAMRSGLALMIVENGKLKGADSHGNQWDGEYNLDENSNLNFNFIVNYTSGVSVLAENVSSKPWHQKFEIVLPNPIVEDKIYSTSSIGENLLHIVFNKLRN